MNSAANLSNMITDPKYIGPGVWYSIHLKAYEAVNDNKIESFIDYMYLLAEKFPCSKCRTHINAYIDSHPFEDLRYLENSNKRNVGMFKWSWLFHNAVNTRLHKNIVDWETAWGMYDVEIEVCSKNCDAVEEHTSADTDITNQTARKQKDYVVELSSNDERKSKLVQGYFMKIGIPSTLRNNGIYDEGIDGMVSFIPVNQAK
jgi:hypothetical protein